MNKLGNMCWNLIEKIVRWCLKILFRIIHKDLDETIIEAFLQFVKFGIVGVSNTIISYVLYAGCLLIFRGIGILTGIDYIVAQVIQFILSVLWSFYWNNKYVFELKKGEKRSLWKSLLKTYVSYSFTGLFLSSILLVLWVQILGISEFIAPIINLLISVPLNFIINKFWAFKKA
ncbi:GtrA family protein [Roseburia sp. MUC/MUC-530-WT-4D]|uniref:GtrA family protein n=1 Tax=Roseburia porci TaxID=2605790 RepID=A0A6L5YUI2_9FIRM|nr:GtrA family protein [Roseburia porci]MST75609.1 GtrA family protein [Roseburia porci]